MNEVAGRRFEQLIAWRLGVRVTKYMLIILKPSQRIIRGQLMHNLVQHSSHHRHHHYHHHNCHLITIIIIIIRGQLMRHNLVQHSSHVGAESKC